MLLLAASLLLLAAMILYPIAIGMPSLPILVVLFLLLGGLIFWWWYGYEDWKNDLYQVTPDQIIDIYKKPFGQEERKAAPLDGIMSSEYKRTVFITVGGAKFDFEDVADPPTVQQDIVKRMDELKRNKRVAEGKAERERMADWLGYYHRTVQEIEREKQQSQPGKPE